MRRAHDPSCLRGGRLRLRRHSQQQSGDSRGLRGQCQLAAGDEIELPRFAPDFQHHDADSIAGQRVGGGAQGAVHIGGAHGHQESWVETEFAQPAHRHRAGFNFREILPHPYQRPPCRHPSREPCDESRRRGTLPARFGEHLMHRGDRKTALKHRIRFRMAERDPPQRRGVGMRLDALDAAAQSRKRVRACAAHASLPQRSVGRHWVGENQKLAHLFMICSNIKLTWPAESIGIVG